MITGKLHHQLYHLLSIIVLIFSMAGAADINPPEKCVRVFYVLPSDVPLDSAYPKGIGKVMLSSQKYFLAQCKYTFQLSNPICEVVKSDKPKSWFASVDDYWNIVNRGTDEVYRILPTVNADNRRAKWKIVIYVDAESPKDGGGGGGGWVGLPKHDADGAKGYPKDTARWCGGMSHELGHCFGLPDASRDDGTVMSADFYHWPFNCIFTADQATKMKNLAANAGFWFDNITGTAEKFVPVARAAEQWTPVICGNQLNVPFSITGFFPATVALYALSGKRVVLYKPAMSVANKTLCTFDVSMLKPGNYVCSLEKNRKNEQTSIVRKIN